MTNFEIIPTQAPGKSSQFLAWHNDVPYLARFTPHGAGFFHRFDFSVADTDFRNTLADDRRDLFADPDDVERAGGPQQYLEKVLADNC